MFVTMNKAKWDSLPADIQAVFTQVSQEWVAKHGEAWDKADDDGRAFVASLNHEIIPLPEAEQARWKEAVKPILDGYVAACKEKGLPGDTFLQDALGLIAKYAPGTAQ